MLLVPRVTSADRWELDDRERYGINRGLVGLWPLDEPGGAVARDLSPYRRSLTATGQNPERTVSPLGRATKLARGATPTPISNGGFRLPAGSAFTAAFWAYIPASGNNTTLFHIGAGTGSSPRLLVHLPYSGIIYWDFQNDGSGRLTTSVTPYVGKWTHFVFVGGGGFQGIYADGKLVASKTPGGTLAAEFVGISLGGSFLFPGVAQGLRIYNRVIAVAEGRRLFREPHAGLIAPGERLFVAVKRSGAAPSAITGDLAATLAPATVASAGAVRITGELSATLGAATVSAAGAVRITGTASAMLGAATATATGTLALVGTATVTLGTATAASAGALAIVGTSANTLGAATLAAEGTSGTIGVLSAALAPATVSAGGVLAIVAAAAPTLGTATAASAGAVALAGGLSATLGAATLTAAGEVAALASGNLAVTLGAATSSATGQIDISGAVVTALAPATAASIGRLAIAGAAAGTLGAATVLATASVDFVIPPVPASRTYRIPAQPRDYAVAAAPRAYTLPALSRRYTVQPEG